MATHAQLVAHLDACIASGQPICVFARINKVGVGRASCGRCSRPARYAGDGESLCGGCAQTKRRDAEVLLRLVAQRYDTNEDAILESLTDEWGMVRIRASSGPVPVLRWHPEPRVLVDALLDGPHQRLDCQVRSYAALLWLVALQDGQDLRGFPRTGQPAPSAEVGVAAVWAQSHPAVYASLLRCAMVLRNAREQRPHSAGGTWGPSQATEQLTWLLANTVPPAIANHNAAPLSPPPGVRFERIATAA